MSEYEHRLQNKAIKALAAQKDTLSAELWSDMFSKLMDKITAGDYAFGGEIASKSLNTVNGVTELISILCSISQEDAMKLVLEEKEGFRTVFDSVIRQSVSSPDDGDESGTGEKKS